MLNPLIFFPPALILQKGRPSWPEWKWQSVGKCGFLTRGAGAQGGWLMVLTLPNYGGKDPPRPLGKEGWGGENKEKEAVEMEIFLLSPGGALRAPPAPLLSSYRERACPHGLPKLFPPLPQLLRLWLNAEPLPFPGVSL